MVAIPLIRLNFNALALFFPLDLIRINGPYYVMASTSHQSLPEAFKILYDTVARLRGPDGCPWDREQSPSTLRGDLIEETYECIEAIDEKDPSHIKEELGDLFLLVTMLSYMHEQKGLFSVADVLGCVTEKLIRRHPHVFRVGDHRVQVKDSAEVGTSARQLTPAEVLDNWARIKVEQEGRKPKDSLLDQVSRGLPPLDRAYKLQKKAAKAGFDWPDIQGVMAKVEEELGEAAAAAGEVEAISSHVAEFPQEAAAKKEALEGELGDLLFSAVNLCRFLKVEPSVALQRTNTKFVTRFNHVEKRMKETGQELKPGNLAAMDVFWNEAKVTQK
jgi:tetrapyrrole methylase family protein/MazG family protein